MKLQRTAIAIAGTAAVFVGGIVSPHAIAQEATTQMQDPLSTLSWPTARVVPGSTVQIAPNGTFPTNVRLEGEDENVGYRLTTNPRTGIVTVQVSEDVSPGEVARFYVTATDGFRTHNYPVTVQTVPFLGEMARKHEGYYEPLFTNGEPAIGRLLTNVELPEGTHFEATAPDELRVNVDADGTLTVEPLKQLPIGWNTEVAVKATFPDGSFYIQGAPVVVVSDETAARIEKSDPFFRSNDEAYAERFQPRWEKVYFAGDEQAVSTFVGHAPKGTTFTLREDLEPFALGVADIKLDPHTGEVTFSPKRPIKQLRDFSIPIQMAYPDGRVGIADAVFSVTTPGKWLSEKADLTYEELEVPTPGPFTSKPTGSWPEGTVFSEPEFKEPGWTTTVDAKTGEVSLTPPERTTPGKTVTVPVTAKFSDGSRRIEMAVFELIMPENPEADSAKITFPDVTVRAGETIEVDPEGLPEGAKLTFGYFDNPGMNMRILPGGRLSMTATESTKIGERLLQLTATFKDGSTKPVFVKITVATTEPDPTETPTPEPTTQPDPTETPEPSQTSTPTLEPTAQPDPTESPKPSQTSTQTPTLEAESDSSGSSTGRIIAIVIGVLAALGGLAFAAKPQLEQMGLWPNLPLPTA